MADKPADEITLHIDRSVALVLFEFLSRTVDDGDGEAMLDFIEDEAELPAAWALLAALEAVLTEPFEENYEKRLRAARKAVTERFGGAFSDDDEG